MKSTIARLAGPLGIIGALVIALASLATALAYAGLDNERYSPVNHFVSELGEVGVSSWAAVFNLGLILGGLCIAVYMIGVALSLNGWWRIAFGLFGLVAGLSGVLVGVFPMNNFTPHALAALGFFLTGWIAVGLFSLYVLRDRTGTYPRWLMLPGILTVAVFILFLRELTLTPDPITALATPSLNRPGVWPLTIYEWLVIVLVLLWVCLVSLHLRRHAA